MLKRYATFCVLLLVLCTPMVLGQEISKTKFVAPQQKILGAEKNIDLGQLVNLRVSEPETTPEYLVSTSYEWKIYDYDAKAGELVELNNVVKMKDSIFFGAGIVSKKFKAVCVATHLFVVKDKAKEGEKVIVREIGTKTSFLSVTITIGNPKPGPDPGPEPGPNPVPGPEPEFPDGTYKLSKAAYRAAADKVKDATARSKGAAALAKSFRGLASAVAAGGLKDMKTALTTSLPTNNTALKDAGVQPTDWDSFGTVIQDAVYELYKDEKIRNVADLATAWIEIAAGLEKVK